MTDLAPPTRYFEDFAIGQTCRAGGAPGRGRAGGAPREDRAPSKTIVAPEGRSEEDDAHFLFFAGLTGDNHPIHYDDDYAKHSRFRGRRPEGARGRQRPTASSPAPVPPYVARRRTS